MTSDEAGGAGIHAQTLATALRARGHRVTLAPVVARPSPNDHGDLHLPGPIEWDSTQPVPSLEAAVREGRGRLAAFAERHGVDLVHCNQFAWVRSVPGVPCLLAVHSDVVSWWRAVHGAPPPPSGFSRWYRGLALRALRQAEMVVTPSAATRADLGTSFDWEGEAEVVFNGWGVAGPPAPPESAPAPARRAGAISAGRLWDEGKQCRLLLRPDLPCPTVLAGEAGARPGPAFAHLRYTGPLGHAELLSLFARSLVYIGTSRYEPFGLAPLEAAASGCCLLLNDIASFREVWGDAAYYFARDDGDDLIAWLRRLVQEPARVERGAEAAARRARRLSTAAMADAYENLYQRLAVAA